MPLFADSPGERSLERMMTSIPNFRPRGYGTYVFGRKELTAEDCDCRLCLYYRKKKKGCTLKRCPCIEERIYADAASRKEILAELAAGINVPAFQRRITECMKESEDKPMDYRNEKHRSVFTEAIRKLNKKDYALMSAVYLLTAEHTLWRTVRRSIGDNTVRFHEIKLQNSTENGYTLFCSAKDLYLGTKHITVKDLADTKLISPKLFVLICNAMAIRRFGLGAIAAMKRGDEAWH